MIFNLRCPIIIIDYYSNFLNKLEIYNIEKFKVQYSYVKYVIIQHENKNLVKYTSYYCRN